MPSVIQHIYFNAPEPSPLLCKIYACLATFGVGATASSGLIQAVSRFFITMLYKHKFLLTFRANWILIMISWVNSAMVAGLLLLSPTAYEFESESHLCTLTTNNFFTSFLAVGASAIFPMVTMIILYGIILYHTVQHTRSNPNTAIAIQAKRNAKVFKRIVTPLGIFGIGGTPYLLCIIFNRIGQTPWPLYSIGFLAISFAAAISSIALLITNDQVKGIFITKLIGRRTNRIVPQTIAMRTLQPLPIIH